LSVRPGSSLNVPVTVKQATKYALSAPARFPSREAARPRLGTTAVDGTKVKANSRLIVVAEVVNTSADAQQLPRVLEAVHEAKGQAPGQVFADAGYRSDAVFAHLPMALLSW
jgi:hypothetical protein